MESSATTGRSIPQTSKKRVFPGSSTFMESEVEVSSPPVNRTLKHKNKMLKQNEDAVVMISKGTSRKEENHMKDGVGSSKEVKSHKKGKGVIISSALDGVIQLDSVDGVSDSYNGKDYMDIYADDYVSDDEYAILQSHFDNIDLPTGVEASVPQFFDSIKMKNKMTSVVQDIDSATGFVQSTHPHHARPSSSSTGGLNLHTSLDTASHKRKVDRIPLRSSAEPAKGTHASSSTCPSLQLERDSMKVHSEHGQIIPMEDGTLHQDSGKSDKSMGQLDSDDDFLRKYRNFKKFDIVEEHSDHHYAARKSAMTQPPKNWAKRIQEEWRILKDLPDMIFVRVYESRMDLLRAVIMGAEGTPYHDGLFFFDVCFPSSYPSSPPQVYYHSGGLHINPNLYRNGKVCLSLLNTWPGGKNEKWVPGRSTMLQVLVSIQGLILNTKPYFNEPALADWTGTAYGERQSLQYNERTISLSLKTMVYTMKNPPKHFEDLVIGHFRDRAHGILKTCEAYVKGVDGEQRSRSFKNDVRKYMKTLVGAFKQIGVKDMEEYETNVEQPLSLTQKIRAFFGI